jgi:hypothetical protein
MIAHLRRMQFGRKLEKIDYQVEQLELELEELELAKAARLKSWSASWNRWRQPLLLWWGKRVRRPLPQHLPREVETHPDHLPLNHRSEIYAREDVELERSTLADWVASVSKLLEPLNETLRKHVITAAKLHAGATPVPVLAYMRYVLARIADHPIIRLRWST